ncbi:MAG: fibronectin type III domain-containing protein, partial [Eubacterium sp.]|nr:fibronectin type III domain-containing protein [Eubacterium sp.]
FKLPKLKIKKIKSLKKGLKVSFKKGDYVSGYQIQYSTSKKFNNKTTKKVNVKAGKTTKTIKKLKAKKKYYVRIRTYFSSNGKKVYSKWSKKVAKKTK